VRKGEEKGGGATSCVEGWVVVTEKEPVSRSTQIRPSSVRKVLPPLVASTQLRTERCVQALLGLDAEEKKSRSQKKIKKKKTGKKHKKPNKSTKKKKKTKPKKKPKKKKPKEQTTKGARAELASHGRL